ncbi:MAG: hypothetical protein KME16_26180 [Scytolyngbya sp. HA4215-MV1]|nr:hypothetical protein [Scytolyngbya sp. HA4215-MV1]
MLYFITIWLFLGIASWLVGISILKGLQIGHWLRRGDRCILSCWLGIIAISLMLLAISFWLPLSPRVGWGLMSGLVIWSVCRPSIRQEAAHLLAGCPRIALWGLGVAIVWVALFTTQQVTWIDTGLYHYGAIRWLRQFGMVPGIALLNGQFGFVSSWFALAAPLNPEIWEGQVSAVTNGFILLLVTSQFCLCLYQGLTNQRQLSDWFMVMFILLTLPVSLLTRLLSLVWVSPSPDAPLIFLVGGTAWSWLLLSDGVTLTSLAQQPTRSRIEFIPLMLSAGAIAIKLIALPLLPITLLFYIGFGTCSLKRLLMGVFSIIGLLLPLLAGGIVTSGCPLYPSTFLCLNLPWSAALASVQSVAEATHGWSTWFGTPPDDVNPFVWRFWRWFDAIGASKLIVILLLVSILSIIYLLKTVKKTNSFTGSFSSPQKGPTELLPVVFRSKMGIFCVILLAILGSLFAVLKAPILRFGMSYFVLLPALTAAILIQSNLAAQSFPFQPGLTALVERLTRQTDGTRQVLVGLSWGAITLIPVLLLAVNVRTRLLLPPALPKVTVVQRTIHNVDYLKPQNTSGSCWASALPCAPAPQPDIRLLNPTQGIAAGFARQSRE